ncbi:unnamed protein product [Kuraishia capsulata CBS 1993]|uniref:Prolyl endopeptidase n=1 Tax=Kuraishia capsulata CBS 1993 TaxID=1382522 RepID=W6MS71_9ASCO|nr:uncharacterized protein KUCA_T00005236001 [Kuraishia capsulata CBS 1993]CDK29248.1 unnamed protein product [Kuraishia capsulata CBS 1993]
MPSVPKPRRSSFVEEKFGIKVHDPYRWMEKDTEETKEYVESHNRLTDSYLPKSLIEHYAAKVEESFPKITYGAPRKYGEYYWWKVTDHVLDANYFVRSKSYSDPKPQTCFKVEDFGVNKSCEFFDCDHTGRYWVGGVQTNGSDWQEVRIFDAEEEKFLDDKLTDVKFTFRYPFTNENAGFFYHKLPGNQQGSNGSYGSLTVYYHRLHTQQSEDVLIWSDEVDFPIAECITDDGQIVFTASVGVDPEFKVFHAEVDSLIAGTAKFEAIDDSSTCSYFFLKAVGDKYYFQTNKNSPRNCIISWTKEDGFETVVSEHEEDTLKYSVAVGNKIMLMYMHDAADVIRLWSPEDGLVDVPDTGFSSVRLYSGSIKDHVGFLELEGYDSHPTVYAIDSTTNTAAKVRQQEESEDSDFVCERVSFPSFDGVEIGMFVSYYKSKRREHPPPVLLHAYGGFNVPEEPRYEPLWTTFLKELGGVLCVVNIRGGGEYGLAWWEAARGIKRQIGWNDYKAGAKFVVSSGITTRDYIVANGISNGGLLVSGCTMQNPELFGCVISDVGIHDLPRFDQFTFGHLWKGEYGDPSKEEDYKILTALSPYHNVKTQELPSLLFTTADNDDRVVPAHSLKMAAEVLYKNPQNKRPIALRMFKGTGHMMGKTTQMIVYESSEKLAFIHTQLGL